MKSNTPSERISRLQRPQASGWQYYVVAVVCCVVLVAGFLLAARQHFSSMEYGLQNSKLRRQLDELQSEKRRLLLNREVAVSPIELRKAVRRIGFIDTPATQSQDIRQPNSSAQRPIPTAINAMKATDRPANKVMKTVLSSPVAKSGPLGKQANRETVTSKKDRT